MILRGQYFSQTLEMDTGLTVLMPDRREENETYKAVYLLHGLCGNSSSWLDYTMLPAYAQRYNMVFIMPEVARSFYHDMMYGLDYFTYAADELPGYCEKTFRFSIKREDTVVIGGSMGGYGALKAAFSRPERFGVCCALSSACLFLKEGLEDLKRGVATGDFGASAGLYDERIIGDFQAAFGEDFQWKEENEILSLIDQCQEGGQMPELYVGCGTMDYFRHYHQRFKDELTGRKLDFTYEELEGFHDWFYFNNALKRCLDWIAGRS